MVFAHKKENCDLKEGYYANPEIFPLPTYQKKNNEVGKLYKNVFNDDVQETKQKILKIK